MRILVADPEHTVQRVLKLCLEACCYAVDVTGNGREGLFLACTNDYDLVIAETLLPEKDGLAFTRSIREKGKSMPILILSSIQEIAYKVALLNAGADDYLTKPFARDELMARIKVLLRRPTQILDQILQIDNLTLNIERCEIIRDYQRIHLTRKEFTLFTYLLRNQGRVMSRASIMDHVWDKYLDPFSNTIETHIVNLRKKIDKGFKIRLIHTSSGRGYKVDTRK